MVHGDRASGAHAKQWWKRATQGPTERQCAREIDRLRQCWTQNGKEENCIQLYAPRLLTDWLAGRLAGWLSDGLASAAHSIDISSVCLLLLLAAFDVCTHQANAWCSGQCFWYSDIFAFSLFQLLGSRLYVIAVVNYLINWNVFWLVVVVVVGSCCGGRHCCCRPLKLFVCASLSTSLHFAHNAFICWMVCFQFFNSQRVRRTCQMMNRYRD